MSRRQPQWRGPRKRPASRPPLDSGCFQEVDASRKSQSRRVKRPVTNQLQNRQENQQEKWSPRETAMFPHNFGYVTVIVAQQICVVGLIWYVVHLLDGARRERRRHYSTMLLTNASASCDLAALAARLQARRRTTGAGFPPNRKAKPAEPECLAFYLAGAQLWA